MVKKHEDQFCVGMRKKGISRDLIFDYPIKTIKSYHFQEEIQVMEAKGKLNKSLALELFKQCLRSGFDFHLFCESCLKLCLE